MKSAALFLGGLLLSALVAGPVSAASVRVKLTSRVTHVTDSDNVLAGKVVVGQRVNGTYVYNTNTPNQSQNPSQGSYHPYANEARMRFAIGSLVFESAQPTQGISIDIYPNGSGDGQFMMASFDNKPLASGAVVSFVVLDFNGVGLAQSTALPVVAPTINNFSSTTVLISGNAGGAPFYIEAVLEAAELIAPDALVVSPASGSFVANQHFDAAVILPRNSTVAYMHATANGAWLPLTYPGNCQLQPQVGAGKPSLLCPGVESAVTIAAGTPIDFSVELTNGTVLTETVNWEVAP